MISALSRNTLFFCLITHLLSTSALATPANEPSTHTQYLDWNQVLNWNGWQAIESSQDTISDAIFGLLSSDINIPVLSTPRFGTGFSIDRKVLDNGPIRKTWTVIDKLSVNMTVPFYAPQVPIGTTGLSFGFFIGTSSGVEFQDIRQVPNSKYDSLPTPENRQKAIETDPGYKALQENLKAGNFSVDSGQWITTPQPNGKNTVYFVPKGNQDYARFSRLWNFFLTPFRLPLTPELFSDMENEEIISYGGFGAVELGVGAGWSLEPAALTGLLESGVSVSIFTKGVFRISVLKKSDTVAKIKVTRERSEGDNFYLGGDYRPTVADAIMIVSQLDNLFKVYPLQLASSTSFLRTMNVTYEYDLSTPNGRRAYQDAVLGSFKASDDLSIASDGRWRTDLQESGVIRTQIQNTDTHNQQNELSTQISFLFKRNTKGGIQDIETEEVLPDGTHRTFSALATNSKGWHFAWKFYNRSQHNFTVKFSLDHPEMLTAQSSFPFLVEGKIEDSNTQPNSLKAYLREVEQNVGIPSVVPNLPERGAYGKSTIYYQVEFKPEHVDQFIHFEEKERWRTLERAFGTSGGLWSTSWARFFYYLETAPVSALDLPLNLFQLNLAPGTNLSHASRFQSKWNEVKSAPDLKTKAARMAEMFVDPLYSREFAHAIRLAIPKEQVGYSVRINNDVLGPITTKSSLSINAEKSTPLDRMLFYLD